MLCLYLLLECTSVSNIDMSWFSFSSGHLDTYHNVAPVETLGNDLFPERIGFQISKSSTFQSAGAGPFPKRLGLQPNDFATAQITRGLFITINQKYISYLILSLPLLNCGF